MKNLLSWLVVFFSSLSQASDLDLFLQGSTADLAPCNLVLNQLPPESLPGSFSGFINYEDLRKNPQAPSRHQASEFILSPETPQIFSTTEQWSQRLTNLRMAISSEMFGIGYSLHICLRGPLENKKQNLDLSEKEYQLVALASHSSLAYAQSAGLYFRVSTLCDLREAGQQRKPRKANELSPSGSLEVDYTYTSNWTPFDGNLREVEILLNRQHPQRAPRFCEVVFQFKESSTEPRPHQQRPAELNVGVDLN